MKMNNWRKGFVLGIISLFIFLGITPQVQSDPPEYITVWKNYWDGATNDYVSENVTMLLSSFNSFKSNFSAASTEADSFEVLQDYGIIPANKTINDWEIWSDNQYIEYKDEIEENLTKYNETMEGNRSYTVYHFEGKRVRMEGDLGGPFFSPHNHFRWYFLWSEYGGSVEYTAKVADYGPSSGDWSTDEHIDMFWFIAVGFFDPGLNKPITLRNNDYYGWAAFAVIWVEDY